MNEFSFEKNYDKKINFILQVKLQGLNKGLDLIEIKNPFGFQKKVKNARCILEIKMNKRQEKDQNKERSN